MNSDDGRVELRSQTGGDVIGDHVGVAEHRLVHDEGTHGSLLLECRHSMMPRRAVGDARAIRPESARETGHTPVMPFSTEELDAQLDRVAAAPSDVGVVELIVARPAVGERLVLDVGEFRPGVGLVGDNYLERGSSRRDDGSADPLAELNIMSARALEAVAGVDRGRWPLAGDQLIVDFDLSVGTTPAGTRLRIGSTIVEVTAKPHTGCAKFAERYWGRGGALGQFPQGPSSAGHLRRSSSSRARSPWATRLPESDGLTEDRLGRVGGSRDHESPIRPGGDLDVAASGIAGTTGIVKRSIMWFRRDLRLADQPALIAAGADGAEVVPLFVVDPAFVASGAPRLAYLHDCLSSLDAEIRCRSGTGLVIRHGDPADVVPRLAEEFSADTVFVSRDYAPYGRHRDAAVAAALRSAGRTLQGVGSPYAVAPGNVRKDDGDPYAVFTPYSKVWRRLGWELPVDVPGDDFRWLGAGASGVVGDPLPTRGDPACDLPAAGEEAAHDLWSQFLSRGMDALPRPAQPAGGRWHEPALCGPQVGQPSIPASCSPNSTHPAPGPGNTRCSPSELAWREFYADVLFHQPRTAWENLNRKMDAMAVDTDAAARARFERWAHGHDRVPASSTPACASCWRRGGCTTGCG